MGKQKFPFALYRSVANPESCACWTLDKHSWGSFIGMFLYLLSGYLYSLPVACVEEMTSSLTNEAMTHILLHAVLMAGFDKTFSINNQKPCRGQGSAVKSHIPGPRSSKCSLLS